MGVCRGREAVVARMRWRGEVRRTNRSLESEGQRHGDGDGSRDAMVFLRPSLAVGYRSCLVLVLSSNVMHRSRLALIVTFTFTITFALTSNAATVQTAITGSFPISDRKDFETFSSSRPRARH